MIDEMTKDEFAALAASIGDDLAVADAMGSHRTTVARWKEGKRPIPGPVRVLVRLLAAQAEADLVEERRQVRASGKASRHA